MVLAIRPDYLDAQLAQAALETSKENYAGAIAISRQIQKQHEKSPVGYIAEGDVLMKQKNPALAAKVYERAFALGRNGALLVKLHAALSQAGKGAEANARLLQWLKERPQDVAVRLYLAETYMAGQQNKAAIEQYQVLLNGSYLQMDRRTETLHYAGEDSTKPAAYAPAGPATPTTCAAGPTPTRRRTWRGW